MARHENTGDIPHQNRAGPKITSKERHDNDAEEKIKYEIGLVF